MYAHSAQIGGQYLFSAHSQIPYHFLPLHLSLSVADSHHRQQTANGAYEHNENPYVIPKQTEDSVYIDWPGDVYETSPAQDLSLMASQSYLNPKPRLLLEGIFKYESHLADLDTSQVTEEPSLFVGQPNSYDQSKAIDSESDEPKKPLEEQVVAMVETHIKSSGRNGAQAQLSHFWDIGNLILSELRAKKDMDKKERLAFLAQNIELVLGDAFEGKENEYYRSRNLDRMIRFVLCFPDKGDVERLSQRLNWKHFVEILKLNDPFAREFYTEMAWYRDWQNPKRLIEEIKWKLYHRTLISRQEDEDEIRTVLDGFKQGEISDLLDLKDLYLFPYVKADFTKTNEEDIGAEMLDGSKRKGKGAVSNLQRFLQEFGIDVTFKDREYEVSLPDHDGPPWRIDILLNRRGRTVIVELKKGKLSRENYDQVEFYANLYKDYKQGPNEEDPFLVMFVHDKSEELEEFMHRHRKSSEIFVALWRTEITPKEVDELISESLNLSETRAEKDRERLEKLMRMTPEELAQTTDYSDLYTTTDPS